VWRQLWRVIERSELVVQIVDGRNPLLFASNDLQKYVKEVNPQKINLLLINKADMLTVSQRVAWGTYFKNLGIEYTFFSASMAREEQELEEGDEEDKVSPYEQTAQDPEIARIIGALDLIDLLEKLCPDSDYSLQHGKRTIGFVGYPNVGKSSTLNALVGATKVAVGSTPGKTKHFQTIHLSDKIILCDCPGLVFPSFATTKADMVVNGVLPIDQLREHIGPCGLIAKRIPKYYLEAIYGLKIKTRDQEGTLVYRLATAEELLCAYAGNLFS
jgi:large subunit GTPase 1